MKINVSETAQVELEQQLKQLDMTNKGLRLYIAGHGWGGPSIGMALDEQKENDQVEDLGSFKILAGEDLTKTLPEVTIEYIDDHRGKGFSVKTGAGGCGDCTSC